MTKTSKSPLVIRSILKEADSVVILSINRPEKANAYNNDTLDCLESELKWAIENPDIHVIMITGEGTRAFCAGADTTELITRGAADGMNLKSRVVFDLLAASRKITIGLINGAAIAGGLELALACDFRISSNSAEFAFTEISLGITPAAGGMRRIQDVIGKGRAKEMVFLGRKLTAAQALEFGLVTHIGDDFFDYGAQYALKLADSDQLALTLAKKNIDFDNSSPQRDLEAVTQALLYEMNLNKKKK